MLESIINKDVGATNLIIRVGFYNYKDIEATLLFASKVVAVSF